MVSFTRWPESDLPSLSIIQDPLDPSITPTKFAQPLVFFKLDPFSALSISPYVSNLAHFRLRVPARQVARFLYALPRSLPNLELLDLSTCHVSEADIEGVLGRFVKLRTLLLDDCDIAGLVTQGPEGFGPWAGLGKIIALSGAKFVREREKKLKAWLEAKYAREAALAGGDQVAVQQGPAPRRPRRGRRGLATATISLRASPPKESMPLPSGSGSSRVPVALQKIRIMPSLPILRSITMNPPPSVGSDKHDMIRAEFERGWLQGVALLRTIRGRLRTSWTNGLRIMRIVEYISDDDDDDEDAVNGLAGLKDILQSDEFENLREANSSATSDAGYECPLLCLAGPGRSDEHIDGCGHQIGWDVWQDEL